MSPSNQNEISKIKFQTTKVEPENDQPRANLQPQKPISTNHTQAELNNMSRPSSNFSTILVAFIIVVVGIGSGYGLFKIKATSSNQASSSIPLPVDSSSIEVGKVYGSQDETAFADPVEGVLISGGIHGEGSHRIIRPGGDSQTVCLTSSVLDLDMFVNHRIKVWGETFDAQKCGWFMDIGRVKVIELNAEKPFEVAEEEDSTAE